ncbi:MAG: inositol monophosphatase [Acidimicrobiia bacterium]|nr:inositol monophosphatase [Acidimicrobiia bacterium]
MISPTDLLVLFATAADAQLAVVEPLRVPQRRARTAVPGQYALDLVADAAVLDVLRPAGVAVVSEESGRSGPPDAPITVVVDPVDGSTNCSRMLPYWAISLCALDADGPLAAFVANQVTGERFTAVRGGGARLDGEPITPSAVTRIADSMLAVGSLPDHHLGWKQFRAMGSCALALCDVAAGRFDGYFGQGVGEAPWDYLGALLICREVGATVIDAQGRDLVTTDPGVRRDVIAAGTPQLLAELTSEFGA